MAFKFYKHLTDGEVKAVEEDSAQESEILADVVTGASYIQQTGAGKSQEVAAAQGTALWEDVSADMGGSFFAHLTENADTQGIRATYDLVVTADDDSSQFNIYRSGDAWGWLADADDLTGAFIGFQKGSDAEPRFFIGKDGSLHIGDGAIAPDLELFRRVVGGKTQLVCNAAGTEVILAAEA